MSSHFTQDRLQFVRDLMGVCQSMDGEELRMELGVYRHQWEHMHGFEGVRVPVDIVYRVVLGEIEMIPLLEQINELGSTYFDQMLPESLQNEMYEHEVIIPAITEMVHPYPIGPPTHDDHLGAILPFSRQRLALLFLFLQDYMDIEMGDEGALDLVLNDYRLRWERLYERYGHVVEYDDVYAELDGNGSIAIIEDIVNDRLLTYWGHPVNGDNDSSDSSDDDSDDNNNVPAIVPVDPVNQAWGWDVSQYDAQNMLQGLDDHGHAVVDYQNPHTWQMVLGYERCGVCLEEKNCMECINHHLYCLACITAWSQTSVGACPACRTPMTL